VIPRLKRGEKGKKKPNANSNNKNSIVPSVRSEFMTKLTDKGSNAYLQPSASASYELATVNTAVIMFCEVQ